MLASILVGFAHVFDLLMNMISTLVIVSVALSWFQVDPRNPIVAALNGVTEPLYRPFRKLTRKIPVPFDFAPMLVMLIVVFLQKSVPMYLRILSARLME